jgi:LuxR family maltose regulon positive regulatory protein
LNDRLALRWDRRVVSVVAGPGFGKTVLLVTAITDSSRPPGARDVWLSCEPADISGDHLVAGLAEAFGLERGANLDDVLAAVWAEAPTPVCFVLDDVHEIAAGSDGASTLARFVDQLPHNGHVVLATRETVPLRTARLAASGQLERLIEADLVFDDTELESFASARGVEPDVLSSSGGWPAVAELSASARTDLVFEYLWDEVLERVGNDRARALARFAVAEGGDDDVARALVPGLSGVDELVADLPLVERRGADWVALHPLWKPALRRVLSEAEADDARRVAADVHRRAGRFSAAIDLFAESDAWDEVLGVIRQAAIAPELLIDSPAFGRWYRMLAPAQRDQPAARFAIGIDVASRRPLDALPLFDAAARGFRSAGDVEGEVAAIQHEGLVRWWANDLDGLFRLYGRVVELAASGSTSAAMVAAIGDAAMAHVAGDSDGTLRALADIDGSATGAWSPTISWFRHVAYRRRGDLVGAALELEVASATATAETRPQADVARLRLDWLAGRVDHVRDHLPAIEQYYRTVGNLYLRTEVAVELASKLAWLGDLDAARDLLGSTDGLLPGTPGTLAQVLRMITLAALAIGEGDEPAAAAMLAADPLTVPGRSDGWYWRDRGALGLLHVLLGDRRAAWDAEPLSRPHLIGLELARALEAARAGDLAAVRELSWPEPGIVRAHLPVRWIAELAAAGRAAGNPAPEALTMALGDRLPPALRALAASNGQPAVAHAAAQMIAESPVTPPHRLRISVLGPLELRRDGVVVDHADLRRRRVRELLCYLVAHPRCRRDVAADALWPDLTDPRHNLRVTLNYLQRVLQPERLRSDPPFFLRTHGEWLALVPHERLEVDAWQLEAHLDEADAAERARDPAGAFDAYRAVLPLWRGEPLADVAGNEWSLSLAHRWRTRYAAAAVRAGELALAKGASGESRRAAEQALAADPDSEAGYQLLARSHLAMDDAAGARAALEACMRTLVELDVAPDATTRRLIATARGRVT